MEANTRTEILEYLKGLRDHSEGAALYRKYGRNLRLKQQFILDHTSNTKQIMIAELRKLAGLTDAEFRALPRTAKTSAPKEEAKREMPAETKTVAAQPVQKMIRFREKYPFLDNPDCPDALKVLVADMFTAYGKYKEAHARLAEAGEDADAEKLAADCEEVVESYLANREIWAELEYYKDTGEILGKCEYFRRMKQEEEISALSDVDLMEKLKSAQVQASKWKKNLAKAEKSGDAESVAKARELLDSWTAKKEALVAERDQRKKK